MNQQFLPICRADMLARGWQDVDFVVVMGDAYVDHPSFGSAIIARLLEKEGWRVGIISQPAYHTCESMKEYGRPRYGFFIGGGNVDSMVAHYSVAKVRRTRRVFARRCGRQAARQKRYGIHTPGKAGIPGRTCGAGWAGGLPAAFCTL